MATTYDKASLVMIPSGVKEDKLYSIKPTSGDGDFTFSRGSDIEATRVNSSGLIEKAKVNLFRYSNVFDNVNWNKINTSVTGGHTGFDGSSDAWLLTKTDANGNIYQSQSYSGVMTLSFYAKANTSDWVRLRNGGGYAYFDVANGVVGGTISDIDSTITSVGTDGWYRIEVAYNGSIGISQLFVADSDGFTSGTSGSVYIQFPQLEYGLIAKDYVDAPTASVVEGLTADLPRLDYSGGASCPNLLLEPSRSNLFQQSEYLISGSGWSAANLDRTANAVVSPEGVQNATEIAATGSGGHPIYEDIAIANGTYTISMFVKKGANTAKSDLSDGYSSTSASFDLDAGTINENTPETLNAFIEPYSDDWYRIGYTFVVTASQSQPALYLYDSSGNQSYTANGETMYIFGLQLELGSYGTSYIPTYGTAAGRGVDECVATSVSDLIGQTEGTLFYEFDIQNLSGQDNDPITITAKDSGGTDNIYIQTRADGGVRGIYYAGGGVQGFTNSGSGYLSDGNHKIAFGYKENDFVLYIDGVQVDTDTSGATSGSFDELYLGYYNNSFNPSINSKQTLLFKTRLTNAELASLTQF